MTPLILGFLLVALATIGACQPEPDRSALLALYQAAGGSSWTTQWNTTATTLCTTSGSVQCWSTGKVRRLYLTGNNLVGSLPTEIGLLTQLDTLILTTNSLSQSLPTELGLLTKLGSFAFNGNKFSGNLPTQLGLLNKLVSLIGENNQLTGNLPTEISNHPSITSLRLTNNLLSGQLPDVWSSKLTTIQLENNQFTGTIPTTIFANVVRLRLQGNQLTGNIPVQAGSAPYMTEFYVFSNSLSGPIPTQLASAPTLQRFWGYMNNFTGSVPGEFGNAPALIDLRLQSNFLSGSIPTQLALSKTLQSFWVSDNLITGEIPTHLGQISSLLTLRLAGNKLEGHVPGPLLRLPNLSLLQLSRTCLGPVEPYSSVPTNDFSSFEAQTSCPPPPYPADALARSPLLVYQLSSPNPLVDSSSAQNDLVINDANVIYQPIPFGQFKNPHNTALQVQGTTNFAFRANGRLTTLTSYTVELLFIAPNLASANDLFAFSTGSRGTSQVIRLKINIDGSLSLLRSSSSTPLFQTAAAVLNPIQMNHVALTFNGANRLMTLYVNGAQRQQVTVSGTISVTGDFYFLLARNSALALDEVAVYGSALSASDVQSRVDLLGWCPPTACLGTCTTTITGYTCS